VQAWFIRNRVWFLVPIFYAVLVSLVWAPLFSGKVGFGWDRVDSYWPDLAYLANQFRKFEFPLWNPYERAGYAAHADPQPGYFYPVHWLIAVVGATTGKVTWWMAQFEELLHDVLLASFMYAYLRSRRFHWTVALFGGAAAAIGGPWMSDKTNNFIESMAWTPLVWLAFDAVIARPGMRTAAGLAAAFYMAVSSGSPPGYFYVVLMVLPYAFFRLGTEIVTQLRRGLSHGTANTRIGWPVPLVRQVLFLTIAGVVAGALLAVVVLPGLELTKYSIRANGLRDMAYIADGFIGQAHSLIGLVHPLGGTSITYTGIFTVLGVVIGITWGAVFDRGVAAVFFLTSVFFLILAFGSQTPVLPWLAVHLPGFDMFRACARYRIPFGICLVPVAARGLQTLLEIGQATSWRRKVGATLLSLAFGVGVYWVLVTYPNLHPTDGPPISRSFQMLALAIALGALILWLPRRFKPFPVLLGVAMLFFDPHGFSHHQTRGFEERQLDAPRWPEVRNLPGLRDYRVYDEFLLEPRSGSRFLLREMRGYQNFDPLATMAYREIAVAAHAYPQLLAEYNIRYIFFDQHYRMGWSASTFNQAPTLMAPSVFRLVSTHVVEVIHPAPWLGWYGGVKTVAAASVIPTLAMMRDPRGRRFGAVVDESLLKDTDTAAWLRPLVAAFDNKRAPPSVAGRITHFNADSVSATINAPSDGLVVLNEANYPGWLVFVDGKQKRDITVDGLLRGVYVSKGQHQLQWRYRPPGFIWMIGLWWFGMATLVVSVVPRARFTARRAPHP
jgi:Bacterial membrane protein YfhO